MNWPGRVVLLIAIFVSVYLFSRKFGRALRIIRECKPDADFQLRPIGPRIRKVLWEVGAQGLVIAQHPLPGLAHAFVFWGFCVFALVTINHFATAFGAGFLSHEGPSRFYFLIAGVFAVAVAISIAGLAFRRFVIRPKWLEPLSPESGLIAFLIFALMVTYLATFWVREGTTAGWVLWWAHTLVLLVFLPLIPSTKHMHLVLSPVTVFLKRPGFSQIPPLVGDEDFGLVTGKDVTQIDALQAYSCVECGRCTEHCPANNTGKILNPKEIILGTRQYLNEFGPKSSEPLLGKHLSMEAAFQCVTCGACEFQCPVGIQHLPIIVGLRRGAVNTGKWDNSYGSELFVTLERQGNALGFPPSDRKNSSRKTACLTLTARRNTACGWVAWDRLIPTGERFCWHWLMCCATWGSVSAFCGRKSAPAIPRGGWATITFLANWRREIWNRFAKAARKKWFRFAHTACARLVKIGRSTAGRFRSNITASCSPVIAISCRSATMSKRAWCFTMPAIWGGIAESTTNRER